MSRPSTVLLKPWALVWLLCLVSLAGRADTLTLPHRLSEAMRLDPYLSVWEAGADSVSSQWVLQHPERFGPAGSLAPGHATSVYWLRLDLRAAGAADTALVLRFSHLTFVDAYLYSAGGRTAHRQAGAFRPRGQLAPGDSRFHVVLSLAPHPTYTLLLKVHHTKGYPPFFDFALQPREAFISDALQRSRTDGWFQGALVLFFLYTLLSWMASRFRPYLWLLLFITGIGLYGLCSGPYFVDWFFHERPARGWLFNAHFLHLGLLGFYLLVIDVWQLPRYNPRLFRFGALCIAVLVTVSVSGFCINYFTGNFYLTNTINLWAFVFLFSFVIALLVRCYRRLDRAQKYLYYGIVLFAGAALFITLSSAFFKERSLLLAPLVSHLVTLAVILIYATGLKEALRQHEIDKWAALQQLTQLQKQQNTLLEQKVTERTHELQTQAAVLARRNATIETLIHELSHRVKNNLQLLYSLSSLQLPTVRDEAAHHLLKGQMTRIRAMMLMNQKLDHVEEHRLVNLSELAADLTRHLQELYDRQQRVPIHQSIPPELELPSRQILSLGLILTELITNSYKYAFAGHPAPRISIKARLSNDGQLQVVYADNGPGLAPQPPGTSSSMGLVLVKDLVRQLGGRVMTSQEAGLRYDFTLPVGQPPKAGKL